MRIFQIVNGFCHWDATNKLKSLERAHKLFAPNIVFVEAPDYVHEGWGFDPNADGDARFIKPTPPEGWLYDDDTGTFYEKGGYKPSELRMNTGELAKKYLDLQKENINLETQLTELQTALCDMFEQMLGGI